jgi:hypothetical protein
MPKTNREKRAAAMETTARKASPRAWQQTDPRTKGTQVIQ